MKLIRSPFVIKLEQQNLPRMSWRQGLWLCLAAVVALFCLGLIKHALDQAPPATQWTALGAAGMLVLVYFEAKQARKDPEKFIRESAYQVGKVSW